jgi:hypothetical protein
MNVSTLILELQKFQEENGDLQVRVNADHGQTPMTVCNVGTGYIDEDTYSPESIHPDDRDCDSIKICEVWG